MLTQFVKTILCFGFALLFCSGFSSFAEAKTFPQIKRASVSISTNPANPKASKTLIIRDVQGKPAYELSLFAISLNNRTTDLIDISLSTTGSYSPDTEEKYESNLLNPDYWGHGSISFQPNELCPANRNNPLYGARREYVLRRMRIIAKVSDIELNDEGIVKMQMTVIVEQSASRRSRPRDVPWGEKKDCNGFASYSEKTSNKSLDVRAKQLLFKIYFGKLGVA